APAREPPLAPPPSLPPVVDELHAPAASTMTSANLHHDTFMTRMSPLHDRTPSAVARRGKIAPTGPAIFAAAMSSARVGPMLTTAIGSARSCARRTNRKPEQTASGAPPTSRAPASA